MKKNHSRLEKGQKKTILEFCLQICCAIIVLSTVDVFTTALMLINVCYKWT